MKKSLLFLLAMTLSHSAFADLATCTNLYVAKMDFHRGSGLVKFTVVQNLQDASGSNWIYLTGWNKEEVQEITSILLSAKVANKKLYLETELEDGNKCGLASGKTRTLTRLLLQHKDE